MTQLRDYLFYEEPGITLYCGDCREVLPLLKCPNTTYCLGWAHEYVEVEV